MQYHTDQYTAYDENGFVQLALMSVIGDRTQQQDAAGYEMRAAECLVGICDGMGGHNGGQLASTLAIDVLLRQYQQTYPTTDAAATLKEAATLADQRIATLTDDSGQPLRAGSTLVAVVVRERMLYWLSVGDSRLYLLRNEQLVQITTDHVYQHVLDARFAQGQISPEEYRAQSQQGDALVSFLGIHGLPQIHCNDKPFAVQSGDKILLASDGLYKVLTAEEIARLLSNFSNVEEAIAALELKAQHVAKRQQKSRDNMTAALLKVK